MVAIDEQSLLWKISGDRTWNGGMRGEMRFLAVWARITMILQSKC